MKEFSELGAGFKIAALDLELRGAGNLLGGEQHGHINAVGFDMYLKLLEEAVHELKGEELPLEVRTSMNLGLDIRIPTEYIAEEHQRLRAYKRIAEATDRDKAELIWAELRDRYGQPPEAVSTLIEFSVLKCLAQRLGIESIDRRQGFLNIRFHPESRIDPSRLMDLVRSAQGVQFTPAGVLRLPVEAAESPAPLLGRLKDRLVLLAKG
jgi:transcription-repair coupling factor (superfamily II helicase)